MAARPDPHHRIEKKETLPVDPAAVYREKIIDEIGYALGVGRSGVRRRLLGPLFHRPAARLGRIAARADSEVESGGISGGARRILPDLSLTVSARGVELIPECGPLLVAANHPGGLDSLAVLSCLPRKDVKVVLSDVPLTRAFVAARRFFIFVPPGGAGRTGAVRTAIDHLRSGGSLLIFPHGDVEPDPEAGGEASPSIQDWSRSLEVMLRGTPGSRLQVVIVSGVLARKFVFSPLVRIRKSPARRQKLAEVLQLSRLMVSPGSVRTRAHISFSAPLEGATLAEEGVMPALVRAARALLDDHLKSWGIPGA
jgi:hypothetical protein